MDIIPENQTFVAGFPVRAGDFVSIVPPQLGVRRKGEVLLVSDLRVRYRVPSASATLEMPSPDFRAKWNITGAYRIVRWVEGSRRDKYLGATPGRGSATGRRVISRYRQAVVSSKLHVYLMSGLITGHQSSPPGTNWNVATTHELLDCDMSHHPVDAVDYWNNTGRHTGEKSQTVRDWMLDQRNYILEPAATNRSRGSANDSTYQDPTV
jgi:hypothetical protein